MKEQLAPGLGEREITEFVEHDEVEAGQIIGKPPLTTVARRKPRRLVIAVPNRGAAA